MNHTLFWTSDETSEAMITKRYGELLEAEDGRDAVHVFYSGGESGVLRYEEIFGLDADCVRGLLFGESLPAKCGGIHVGLGFGALFEMLVRMAAYSGEVVLHGIDPVRDGCPAGEEVAFLYAYVLRESVDTLHRKGLTEQALSAIYARMDAKGCRPAFQECLQFLMENEAEYEKLAGYTAPFLILKGDDTCHGVLREFADDLADALVSCGQAVLVAGEDPEQYDALQNRLYKGIVGFQTKALEIPFFQKLHGPKFQFWFDYPLNFQGVLQNLSGEHYVLCQDGDYARQIREYFRTPGAVHFPPGGVNPEREPDPEAERPYDIVFVGAHFANESGALNGDQKEFYEFMLQNPGQNFENGLRSYLNLGEAECRTEAFLAKTRELKPARRAVIAHFRDAVIRCILDAGLDIHVYGESWQSFDAKGAAGRLICHPSVSVRESLKEWQKAKIGLNMMSWHKNGMTERIANILLSGAVCLSEETAFLHQNFEDGEDILLYRLDRLEDLPRVIRTVLEDDGKRAEMARKAFEKALARFTWNARAAELIALAEDYLAR